MSIWRKSREARQRVEEIDAYTDKVAAELAEKEPHLNALANWLISRKTVNGFGADWMWDTESNKLARRTGG